MGITNELMKHELWPWTFCVQKIWQAHHYIITEWFVKDCRWTSPLKSILYDQRKKIPPF
jgi:hypothetical protein